MAMAEDVRNLAILGTASHAGKSVIAAGLCRLFRRHGISIAPFKSQNMALNSFVISSGGEMGRAQVVQAEAAGVEPCVDMNPILLKPSGNNRIQVILQGRVFGTLGAQEYYEQKPFFFQKALESHACLAREFDLVVIEGAGSPVEINLLDRDIVNLPRPGNGAALESEKRLPSRGGHDWSLGITLAVSAVSGIVPV